MSEMKPKKLERDDSMLSQLSDITLCFACDKESRTCNNDGYTPGEVSPPDFNPVRLRHLRRTFSSSARLDALRHPLNYDEYEEAPAPAHSLPEHLNYWPSSDDGEIHWEKFEYDLMLNKHADDLHEILENQLCVVR
ncbi:unnamed protein product, partial [Hymenolepis diminuta]|uniref:ELM2 domain-containing protein n=1 Tax=Hymenolepis diminuta TaxID=6216 RepID=A0A0R3SNP5_HYMDI